MLGSPALTGDMFCSSRLRAFSCHNNIHLPSPFEWRMQALAQTTPFMFISSDDDTIVPKRMRHDPPIAQRRPATIAFPGTVTLQ